MSVELITFSKNEYGTVYHYLDGGDISHNSKGFCMAEVCQFDIIFAARNAGA
jgi:hypothetical protein